MILFFNYGPIGQIFLFSDPNKEFSYLLERLELVLDL